MGLLSFLTRKRLGDKEKAKPQQPDVPPRTAVPEPAFAATEGPRGRPGSSKVITASNADLSPDNAAPSPAVPLFREDSAERPSTAPIGKAPSATWVSPTARLRKSQLHGAPPVSLHARRPSTANPAPSNSSTRDSSAGTQTFTGHSRSNSLLSETGSRYKDLLDAQSEIRPANFKSRVKASGARDYGEDVADRNLAENGFDLDSSPVQAFYAHSNVVASHNASRFAHQRSTSSLSSSYGFRNKLGRSTMAGESISLSDSNSPLLRRRQSLNTHLPASSVGHESDPNSRRRSGLRVVSNSIMTPKVEKPSWDLSALPSLGLKAPIVFGPPKLPRLKTTRPSTAQPSTTNPPKIRRESLGAVKLVTDDAISFTPPLRSPALSQRGSVNGPMTYPRKRHSIQTLQSSHYANRDLVADMTPLSYPRHKRQNTVKQTVADGYTTPDPDSVVIDFDIAASPTRSIGPSRSLYLKTPFTIHEAQEEAPEEQTTPTPADSIRRSTSTAPDSPLATTPRRHRGWSVSSATPTASSTTSSNPFRPASSRHTANTSVDLGDRRSPSLTKVPSLDDNDNFNIDDYISSDSDSFVTAAPRRPRAEGEEDLLFSAADGSGFQLPGLCDAFPRVVGKPKPTPSIYDLPHLPTYHTSTTTSTRRFILDTAAHSDSESESDGDAGVPRHVGTKRLAAIASPDAYRRRRQLPRVTEEEERGNSKVDVSAAVRLRKETKARRRKEGVPGAVRPARRRRDAVGPVMMIRVEAVDEEGFADGEEVC